MKQVLESLSELSAATAAAVWFMSARVRLRKGNAIRRGLAGLDDPKEILLLIYRQSRWSAWGAIFAGLAALFALADGLVPNT